jgi:RNA polymerase sigma-70 factor (ECF subfamily)
MAGGQVSSAVMRFAARIRAATGRELDVTPWLAEAVARALDAGRVAWPEVGIDEGELAARFADRLPANKDAIAWLAAVHAADLYLAIACELSDREAIAAFDRAFIPKIAEYLGRGRHRMIDDVTQLVRERLLVARPGERARIASYSGRGPLAGWLRVVALRTASNALRTASSAARSERRAAELGVSAFDPELDFLKARYRPLFREALEASIRSLPPKRRNLLRLYFLDHLTLAQIGALFGLHESSIARQLESTRHDLLESTRRELVERRGLRRSEAESIIQLVGSRADLALSSLLPPA